jgi:hypothetical protein
MPGQCADIPLLSCRADLIGLAAVLDNKLAANFEQSRRGNKSGADIAVRIEEVPRVHTWRKTHRLIADNVPIAGGMGGEDKHHWNCVGTLKSNVVACPDFRKDLQKMCGL